jgi:hypothetical protein
MYFLARLKDLSEDTWLGPLTAEGGEELYLTSLYLSVVTFCTVGKFSGYNCPPKGLSVDLKMLLPLRLRQDTETSVPTTPRRNYWEVFSCC